MLLCGLILRLFRGILIFCLLGRLFELLLPDSLIFLQLLDELVAQGEFDAASSQLIHVDFSAEAQLLDFGVEIVRVHPIFWRHLIEKV